MDEKRLTELRERFGNAKGYEIYDERFKRVADSVFSDSGDRKLPYGGISTLLDAAQAETADGLDVALVGVPMDLGVSNRSGARLGPRAVRGVERIGPYHHHLDVLPSSKLKYADIGDVPFRSRFSIDSSMEDIEQFYHRIVAAGAKH